MEQPYAIITGGNSGLGYACAQDMLKRNYNVLLACRHQGRAEQAVAQLQVQFPQGKIHYEVLDLASRHSIVHFAQGQLRQGKPIDCLLNNAGIMMIPYQQTAEGYEMQMGTNHLGHFALTALLLPLLGQSTQKASRVVTVSSLYHRMGRLADFEQLHQSSAYNRQQAYADSKLANLLFARKLHQLAQQHGRALQSYAAHPGYAATNLQTYGAKISGNRIGVYMAELANRLLAQSAEQGALPLLEACYATDLPGGSYRGPQGFLELWGQSGPAALSQRAQDEALADALWEISCRWMDVEYKWT